MVDPVLSPWAWFGLVGRQFESHYKQKYFQSWKAVDLDLLLLSDHKPRSDLLKGVRDLFEKLRPFPPRGGGGRPPQSTPTSPTTLNYPQCPRPLVYLRHLRRHRLLTSCQELPWRNFSRGRWPWRGASPTTPLPGLQVTLITLTLYGALHTSSEARPRAKRIGPAAPTTK